MGTITATMLVGTAHQNHGGIGPTHQLLLSENSRPAWSLHALHSRRPLAVWIPTVRDMLEDGLLMVGLLVLKDAELIAAAGGFQREYNERAELYDDISEADRRRLYERCRLIGPKAKLVVTVLYGSSIAGQLGVLAKYRFGVEVCTSVYCREYSVWAQGVQESGSLPDARPDAESGAATDGGA